MSKIELVPYDFSDRKTAEDFVALLNEYYKNSPWPPTVEKIMKGHIKYYRAFHHEVQIGFTGYDLITPNLAETIKTTVFHEFQGKGLGSLLSQAIEDECKSIGVKKVRTTIYYFNHAMVSIKLKQGYTIEGYHPDHEAPGFHEYSLGKVLK